MMRHSLNCCLPIAIRTGRTATLFSRPSFPRVPLPLVIALIALLSGGCGGSNGSTAKVEGTVTIEGEPVPQGIISFTPRQSGTPGPATAKIVDGRYQATGVPLGPVLVQIHATKETGKMLTDRAEGGQYPETIDLVPDKYRTGIDATISGDESHDFNLTVR